MKRIGAILLVMLLLCGCSASPAAETAGDTAVSTAQTVPEAVTLPGEAKTVGICLPDKDVQRWADEADAMAQALRSLGYHVQVSYADGSAQEQARQVAQLVQTGADCLIIAPIDPMALLDAEAAAKEAGIPIIAYDRLLMDTDAVSAFVGFDYYSIGAQMGTYIAETKLPDMAADSEEHYTIEFFMGAPEDNNALQMYLGLMSVLQPYLNGGVLVCATGRTAFEDCCVPGWDETLARGYCARYLAENYVEKLPDILCAASDALARGCIETLEGLETPPESWPLITGCGGGELPNRQAATAKVDTMLLTDPAVQLAHALMCGETLPVNDTEKCHNNVITVPAYLCEFTLVTGEETE